jgi:hypothetical protein
MAKDALLALLTPKSKGEEGAPEDEAAEGHDQAAADVMDALKSGDVKAFGEALETFVLNCQSKYGPEKDESEG